MKFVRSIVAIVVGWLLAVAVILSVQVVNFFSFKPADIADFGEFARTMQENPQKIADWVKTLPVEALIIVVAGWALGAFLGGLVAALISGWARCWHAGIIGGVILLSTIHNFYDMKNRFDIVHPDWMIVAGLLLPLPMSLLAGKIVSMMMPK